METEKFKVNVTQLILLVTLGPIIVTIIGVWQLPGRLNEFMIPVIFFVFIPIMVTITIYLTLSIFTKVIVTEIEFTEDRILYKAKLKQNFEILYSDIESCENDSAPAFKFHLKGKSKPTVLSMKHFSESEQNKIGLIIKNFFVIKNRY